jgi:hypothetical protein
MAFDLNPSGNIICSPLVSYDLAVIADAGCLVRLVLGRPEDQLRTGSTAVQVSMSAEQLESLVRALQKMVDHIRTAQQAAKH